MTFTPPDWAIAITASRESTVVLLATLDAVVAALDRRATIDLLINGNQRLAEDIAARLQDPRTRLAGPLDGQGLADQPG